jgi:hypothetical protein
MKKNKINKAEEKFVKNMQKTLEGYYKQAISDNIKRGIEARKIRLSTDKVAM